jgi:hypothetical protein
LFDVRVIIRQGIQYAMARGVLLSIVPLLSLGMLTDMALHADQSLAVTVRSRGWMYVFLGVLVAIVYQRRQAWLDRINRVFFRDRYDAHHLLHNLVHTVKASESLEEAAPEVVSRIERALHPEFVSLLHRPPQEAEFRTIASEPPGQTRLRLVGA